VRRFRAYKEAPPSAPPPVREREREKLPRVEAGTMLSPWPLTYTRRRLTL